MRILLGIFDLEMCYYAFAVELSIVPRLYG